MNRANCGRPSPIMNVESARESARPNRAERRRMKREFSRMQKETVGVPDQRADREECDFSGVPTITICKSIMLLIDELRRRGCPVYDFDHKDASVQGMQIIGQKIYFFMAREEGDR